MITSENQWEIKCKPRIKTEPQHIRCSLIYKIDFGFSAEAVVGIETSTMQKGAISWECLNTFVHHCLNAKLCYCTHVGIV